MFRDHLKQIIGGNNLTQDQMAEMISDIFSSSRSTKTSLRMIFMSPRLGGHATSCLAGWCVTRTAGSDTTEVAVIAVVSRAVCHWWPERVCR